MSSHVHAMVMSTSGKGLHDAPPPAVAGKPLQLMFTVHLMHRVRAGSVFPASSQPALAPLFSNVLHWVQLLFVLPSQKS